MALRDSLLPVFHTLRNITNVFGLRRYAVTLRRRVWTGPAIGQGTPEDQDILLLPPPKVRDAFGSDAVKGNWSQLEYILQHGHTVAPRLWIVKLITPQFFDKITNLPIGGYTPAQLRMEPPPDSTNIECIVILVGDDGVKRECAQVSLDLDRAFHYTMLVKETDRPMVALSSLSLSLPVSGATQMVATGTFEDGTTSLITPLCTWTSSDLTVATIDALGNLTPLASGTATITATFGVATATFSYVVP